MKNRSAPKSFQTSPDDFYAFKIELLALLDDDNPGHVYLRDHVESKLMDFSIIDSKEVLRSRAIKKWLASEKRNLETNQRLLLSFPEDVVSETYGLTWGRLRRLAAKHVRRVIGDSPIVDDLRGSFSNGASTDVRAGMAAIPRKYLTGRDVTESCLPWFDKITEGYLKYIPSISIVQGNVLFTVPKNTSIDRCAAKEPTLNMYVQKAIGNYFRKQLMGVGVNLNDQSVNQKLAKQGSSKGDLATVDLSSASDSVTTQLVCALLPIDWFCILMDVRSPHTLIDEDWHENAMISSMGNAYTFELESLLFWALTKSVIDVIGPSTKTLSVYGDDIICPTECVGLLKEVLEYCGFLFNDKKTCVSGPLRESCGKHFYNGVEVSPFFLRKVAVDVRDWIHILNAYRHWVFTTQSVIDILDPEFYTLWYKYAVKLVPAPLWGGYDYARKDVLVSYGRSNIARLALKKLKPTKQLVTETSYGCYLFWLDTRDRLGRCESPERWYTSENHLVTSDISTEGTEPVLRRAPLHDPWRVQTAPFPQELGVGRE